MDGVDVLFLRHRNDSLDVEIGSDGTLAGADQIRLIRLEAVDAEAVLLRIHGHSAESQFGGGAKDADGDFRPVGGHQPAERTDGLGRRRGGGTMRHTRRPIVANPQRNGEGKVRPPGRRGAATGSGGILPRVPGAN